MDSQTRPLIGLVGSIAVTLIGVFAFMFNGWQVVKVWNAAEWPKVAATVKISGTSPCSKNGGFSPSVWYVYTVGSKDYTSLAKTLQLSYCGSPAKALSIADQYQVGSSMEVYVDPRDPAESKDGVPRRNEVGVDHADNLRGLAMVGAFCFLSGPV